MNLWHNPAVIADSSYTTSFANFLLNPNFPAITVGGVINNFPTGRQQVCNFSGVNGKHADDVDGLLHDARYGLEFDFELVDPCLDPLGNKGPM